jgi:PIN domain nuclease of toxin-antitoxin system
MALLDTCTLLWLVSNASALSHAARAAIEAADVVYVSPISVFEIGRKNQRGSLTLPLPPIEWYESARERHGLVEISLTGRIMARAAALSPIHKDPADRFLIATAMEWGTPLITPDEHIRQYPQLHVIW